MADEEVKVIVTQESKGDALEKTRRETEKASEATRKYNEELNRSAREAMNEPLPELSKSRKRPSAWARAAVGGAPVEDKAAQKEERDARAETLREERALARDIAETKRTNARVDAGLNKQFAAEDKAEKRATAAAERQHRKTASAEKKQEHAEESQQRKTAAAEKKQEHQEETRQSTTGRMLLGGRSRMHGGLIGGAAVFGIGEAFTEYTERQGIALRAAAQRAMDVRGLAIAGSWRGSSSKTLAQVQGLDDDIARQEENRPELERKAHAGIFDRALSYGAAGAGTGFALSGGNPIGAGIGFVAGAATGAWKSSSEGEREKDEDRKTLEAKKKKRDELEALGKKQVREEDGQIEMDLASHRADRTMSGSRAVVIDEAKKKYLDRYRALRAMNLSDEEAHKTAGVESETAMRDRQIAAGSGLVDARSGAGDIAAAARWAGMSTPGMAEVSTAIGALHETVKGNSQKAEELHNRKDHSIEAQDRRK